MKRIIAIFFLALLFCAGILGASYLDEGGALPFSPSSDKVPSEPSSGPEPETSPAPESAPPQPQTSTIRLKAVGDNLIHDSIYRQAQKNAGGSGFDFSPAYERIAGIIADADISYLSQETIIAERLYPLSGYPLFNTPEALGRHMVDIGFDVVGIANNHMFDMGQDGLLAALDFWEGQGLPVFGAWRSEEAMQQPILTEVNGITIGWIPMTEHTNGLKLPADTPVRYLLTSERDLMRQQVELAKQYADFVIVVPHWGTEYSLDANDNQLELAQLFADWGVDLILGGHSHTLQPIEWRTGVGGNRTLVVYSLGNMVGSMLYPQNMLGGILDIDITKNLADGEAFITRVELIPTVIHYEGLGANLRTYPFSEYSDELAASHGLTQLAAYHGVSIAQGIFSMDYMRGIIQKNIPKEFRQQLVL